MGTLKVGDMIHPTVAVIQTERRTQGRATVYKRTKRGFLAQAWGNVSCLILSCTKLRGWHECQSASHFRAPREYPHPNGIQHAN